ncbi:MAG: formyltetrahydrofolate deformylase [Pseudomonadota bacterium]
MFILRLSCIDKPGIVAAVAGALADAACNIEESSQFFDHLCGRFFMRVKFSETAQNAAAKFENAFTNTAAKFDMEYQICDASRRLKTLLVVSKPDHCLNDVLYRWRTKTLPIELVGVISNHEDSRDLVVQHGLDFHHLPITPKTKAQQEAKVSELIESTGAELSVLARYMQILSEDMSAQHAGRMINIHHSFLPGFKGAKPYHQAYERGVKIIGATAHFVTSDLDEGPIIVQQVVTVTHADTPERLIEIGQENETRALAEAIRLYAERRIFVQGNRTIIL